MTIDRHSGELTFRAGAFDYETAARSDEGGRYYLIGVSATSRSSLAGADPDGRTTSRYLKIYVTEANEAPASITVDDGVTDMSDEGVALKAAFDALVAADTSAGTIGARSEAFTKALSVFAATHGSTVYAALRQAAAALDAALTAGTGGAPATADEMLATLRAGGTDVLETAFTTAYAAATAEIARVEGRLVPPTEGQPLPLPGGVFTEPLLIGEVTVSDIDAGDTHSFIIGGPFADLFDITIALEGEGPSLYYVGGQAGLSRLSGFVGGRFDLPVTVRDAAGAETTFMLSIVHEAVVLTSPALAADNRQETDPAPDRDAPAAEPVRLPAVPAREQAGTEVAPMAGGLFEGEWRRGAGCDRQSWPCRRAAVEDHGGRDRT